MPKPGKKGRKIGRNKAKCEQYSARGTRAHNKTRRAAKDARRTREPVA